jgi:hypothetical protein
MFGKKNDAARGYERALEILHYAPPPEDLRPEFSVGHENPRDGYRIANVPIPFGVGEMRLSAEQLRRILAEGRAGRVEGWGSAFVLWLVKPDGSPGESITGDSRDEIKRKTARNELILQRAERIRRAREAEQAAESRKRAEEAADKQRAEEIRRNAEARRAADRKALDDAMALCAEADRFAPED